LVSVVSEQEVYGGRRGALRHLRVAQGRSESRTPAHRWGSFGRLMEVGGRLETGENNESDTSIRIGRA